MDIFNTWPARYCAGLWPRFSPEKQLGLREGKTADHAIVCGFIGDAVVTAAALLLSFWLRFRSGLAQYGTPNDGTTLRDYFVYVPLGVVMLVCCFAYGGIYNRTTLLHFRDAARRIARAVVLWFLMFLAFALFFQLQPPISRAFGVIGACVALPGLLGWRALFHRVLTSERISSQLRQRVVFIGWTAEAGRLAQLVWQHETDPYQIVGYVDLVNANAQIEAPANIPYLGDFHELGEIIAAEHVDVALLTDVNAGSDAILDLATLCEKELVQFKIIPSYFPILVSGLHVEMVSGTPVLGVDRLPLTRLHNRVLKRALDIAGALFGLVLALPVVAVFGALVYRESPGPILYRQRRLGRKGKPFEMLKIRSMRIDAEKDGKVGWSTKEDPRRLKIGTLMRKWNIDEVPQFWNVLTGEMSLVGPRPERPELIKDFKHEIAHYNARHFIKPGLTGWAQVNGLRGDTDLSERIRHDLHYLEHWTLWLDVRAMFLTFFKRENAC